jgi:hypothetical protein
MPEEKPYHDWNAEADQIARLHGVQKLDAYLDLAQRLEERGDVEGSIDILKSGIDSSSVQGRLQYTLQFFGHLRRIYLADGQRAHLRHSVLWYYKWIAEAVIQYAEIPLATVETVIEEMERFYIAEEAPLRPVWKIRCVCAMYTGKEEDEQHWFDRWNAEPPSDADDCEACEWGFRAERLLLQKRDADALEIAKPITSTKNWCRATPEIASLLIPAAMRCDEAALAHWLSRASGYQVRTRDSMLDSLGYHITYRGMVGELDRSRRLAIVGLLKIKDSRNDRRNAIFYRLLAYWAAIATLQTQGKMTLPAKLLSSESDAERVPIANTVDASLKLARLHASVLDARNGTDLYMGRVEQFEEGIRGLVENPPHGE